MSEITVVIPNYNGMKYLAECMTSLCREQQNAPGYEVLIIDNASVDGSVEYLQKEWCGEGVRLISLPENTGFCHAVNLGIREAKTPYVILLNNDTKAEAGFVRGLYDAIRENEKIFSVSAKMLMWDRPELIDDAGDRYCVLGWAYSRGRDDRRRIMISLSRCFPPVVVPQSTDDPYLKRSVILMKNILPTWKIWISATVPGSTAMRTGMNRRRLCCIMAVLPRDPDTIPGKRYLRLPTVFM